MSGLADRAEEMAKRLYEADNGPTDEESRTAPAEAPRPIERPHAAREEGSQLARLARPFPSAYVRKNPTGFGSYVTHSTVNQRLLQVVGPFDLDVVDVIRGRVVDKADLGEVVVGVVVRLSVVVDSRLVQVSEIGDCEIPSNWPHDGARMKDAISDALKRCAMRLGLGLHLWAQEDYYLYDRLRAEASA